MLAALQLRSFSLIDFHLTANPAFSPPDEEGQLGMTITVRGGQPLVVQEDDESAEGPPIGFSLDVTTDLFPGEPEEDLTPFRVVLSLGINTDDGVFALAPYQCSAAVFGDFTALKVPEDQQERERVLRVIRANAAGILYGVLRPLILQATQLSPFSPLLLPSLSFREIVEREEELDAVEGADGDAE